MKYNRLSTLLIAFSFIVLSSSQIMANQFGYDGRDGYRGANAQSGKSASDVNVYARNQRQFIDIAGLDASNNARRGDRGQDATSCYQPRTNYNLYGADGGDGGHGGNGGNGGNGGDATVFFKDIQQLTNIQIDNSGGYGSEGAQGSYGGRACRCERYTWYKRHCFNEQVCKNVRVCKPKQQCRNEMKCRVVNGVRKCSNQRVCETVQDCRYEKRCHTQRRCEDRRYTCRDGREGSRGRDGSHGSKGSRGSIKIVKDLDSIPRVRSYASQSITDLIERPVTLSQNIWRHAAGARSLFAQGSNIGDKYSEFIKTAYNQISAQWDSPRPIEKFSDLGFNMKFSESGHANISLNSSHLIDYYVKNDSEEQSHIVIKDVYKANEVSQLSQIFEGRKSQLKIIIKDAASLSNTIKTQVHLKLELGQFLGSKTLFDGYVQAEHVDMASDKITIHAGRFANDARKMRKGRKIKYTLTIKRSFGAGSKTITLKRDKITIR